MQVLLEDGTMHVVERLAGETVEEFTDKVKLLLLLPAPGAAAASSGTAC